MPEPRNDNVAPETADESQALDSTRTEQPVTPGMSQSARWLRSAQICPIVLDGLTVRFPKERFVALLDRWQALGYPDPELEPGEGFQERFEQFVNS